MSARREFQLRVAATPEGAAYERAFIARERKSKGTGWDEIGWMIGLDGPEARRRYGTALGEPLEVTHRPLGQGEDGERVRRRA